MTNIIKQLDKALKSRNRFFVCSFFFRKRRTSCEVFFSGAGWFVRPKHRAAVTTAVCAHESFACEAPTLESQLRNFNVAHFRTLTPINRARGNAELSAKMSDCLWSHFSLKNSVWWFSEESASASWLLPELGKGQVSADEAPRKTTDESVGLNMHLWADVLWTVKKADWQPEWPTASQPPNLLLTCSITAPLSATFLPLLGS